MNRRLTAQMVTGVVLFFLYALSYTALQQYRGSSAYTSRSTTSGIWGLPTTALLAIAGEFKGMVANYLTLEAGAQLGTHVIRNPDGGYMVLKKEYDWAGIHEIFVASQALDPSFAQTFIVAQGWLPWPPANMLSETQEILATADRGRHWDWQPLRVMGFNAYYFLNNHAEAGNYFLQAAKKPDAPSFLTILGARMAQKGGRTETAIVFMKSMLADKDPGEPGYADMVDRLLALEGVLTLEKAVKSYETSYGRKPPSLAELVISGVLSTLPPNPYNIAYCMDDAGLIYFDNPDCLKGKPQSN